MTCEICGNSQMNVCTYQFVVGCKIDACTPCTRELDQMVENAARDLKMKLLHQIKFPGRLKNS